MRLVSVEVKPFRSIGKDQTVAIDPRVTVFVGMNEAGKTVFLTALHKAADASGIAKYKPIEDYPRKELNAYNKRHASDPADVVKLTFELTDEECAEVAAQCGFKIPAGFKFSTVHDYMNGMAIEMSIDESQIVARLARDSGLSASARKAVQKVTTLRAIPEALNGTDLTDKDDAFLATLSTRIGAASAAGWDSVAEHETWSHLSSRVPKFAYFGEYELLPDKTNLAALAQRLAHHKTKLTTLTNEDRAVLALLRMADVSTDELTGSTGYEAMKAKIEAVSIVLTDQIMEFWKSNENLEVEIDIKADSTDEPPFNNGPNLYLRIKNKRHRGVSTPFRQRSKGFVWFFSFLVWFDEVQHQLGANSQLILLLDEPGLSLHALAQKDLLTYIDTLAKKHQVLYTTHSPFMVHSDRLSEVRVVEDRDNIGTIISDNVGSSNARTIFPLQAALGYTIAQNLFVSERNLLVEGPSELVYLQTISSILEREGRQGLREDVTIVPVGGLDKVATFVALLGASGLKLAVLHDYRGAREQQLDDLIKNKLISAKAVLNASQFRDLSSLGTAGKAADIEDLFTPALYLDYFNKAFAQQLGTGTILEPDLLPHDRIIGRLERSLQAKNISVRPSGGFNHYTVAAQFARDPVVDADTASRFEALFRAANALF